MEKPLPCIFMKGALSEQPCLYLVADRQILCEVNGGLADATIGLMAVFYVFMYEYPGGLSNYYLYLQHCVIQIRDGRKLPVTVMSLVEELDKHNITLGSAILVFFHENPASLAKTCQIPLHREQSNIPNPDNYIKLLG